MRVEILDHWYASYVTCVRVGSPVVLSLIASRQTHDIAVQFGFIMHKEGIILHSVVFG